MERNFEKIIPRIENGLPARTLSRGSFLATQDDVLHDVYFVTDGLIKLYRSGEDGKELLIGVAGPGELLGELEFFLDIPIYCHLECVYETRILVMSKSGFAERIASDREFRDVLLSSLSTRLHNITVRTNAAANENLDSVILKMIRENQRLNLRFTRRMYADYLGISERSVNRCIKRLEDAGSIVRTRGALSVL